MLKEFREFGVIAITDKVKLPRKLSREPGAPAPLRPSHERIIEELDRWANSPGLQPPSPPPTTNGTKDDAKNTRSRA
ncbi:hypothetical protein [Bradyrhizobium genosp. P]|uniref:hypothetical protein n=1 Tax=Bradyrhizobium genosp. P TaxID=83641 RepID=UPI003CF7500F